MASEKPSRLIRRANLNIRLLIIFVFFANLIFFTSILTLFALERGLHYIDIFLFGAVSSFSTAILEIPSGIIVDRNGRKTGLVLSGVLLLSFTLLLYYAHSFYEFLVAALIWGAASAMLSGSKEALTYESLRYAGRESEARAVFGRLSSSQLLATSLALPIGSVLASVRGLSTPVLVSAPMMALALITALALYEPSEIGGVNVLGYKQLIREAYSVLKMRRLRTVILNQAVVTVATHTIFYLSQPHFLLSGIGTAFFGFIMVAATGLSAFSAYQAQRLERVLGVQWTASLTSFLPGLFYLLLSFTYSPLASALGFIVIVVLRETREPLFISYRNRLVRSQSRATMTSTAEAITALIGFFVKPAVGYMADQGLPLAFVLVGSILLVTPFVLKISAEKVTPVTS